MQKRLMSLREEAKVCFSSLLFCSLHNKLSHLFHRAGLSSDTKTKSESVYSMVKGKGPRHCVFL